MDGMLFLRKKERERGEEKERGKFVEKEKAMFSFI